MVIRCIPIPVSLVVFLTCSYCAAAYPEPIVVTGTRTALTVEECLAAVQVITQEDSIHQQVQTIQDVRQGLTGVTWPTRVGLDVLAFVHKNESTHHDFGITGSITAFCKESHT